MTSPSNFELIPTDLGAYGAQRARDAAFDAIRELWAQRKSEGLKQSELAARIGRDRGWVSACLRGPANWTMRTLGELAAGLGGEIEIRVIPLEKPSGDPLNYSAYDDYTPDEYTPAWANNTSISLSKPVDFHHAG